MTALVQLVSSFSVSSVISVVDIRLTVKPFLRLPLSALRFGAAPRLSVFPP